MYLDKSERTLWVTSPVTLQQMYWKTNVTIQKGPPAPTPWALGLQLMPRNKSFRARV